VVADEVRKLASNVEEATKKVNQKIVNITDSLGKVSGLTERLRNTVIETQSKISQTMKDFDNLSK
jgi:methyl-accepting chemotaxis protein